VKIPAQHRPVRQPSHFFQIRESMKWEERRGRKVFKNVRDDGGIEWRQNITCEASTSVMFTRTTPLPVLPKVYHPSPSALETRFGGGVSHRTLIRFKICIPPRIIQQVQEALYFFYSTFPRRANFSPAAFRCDGVESKQGLQ